MPAWSTQIGFSSKSRTVYTEQQQRVATQSERVLLLQSRLENGNVANSRMGEYVKHTVYYIHIPWYMYNWKMFTTRTNLWAHSSDRTYCSYTHTHMHNKNAPPLLAGLARANWSNRIRNTYIDGFNDASGWCEHRRGFFRTIWASSPSVAYSPHTLEP